LRALTAAATDTVGFEPEASSFMIPLRGPASTVEASSEVELNARKS
jgi:hypothetical protein